MFYEKQQNYWNIITENDKMTDYIGGFIHYYYYKSIEKPSQII